MVKYFLYLLVQELSHWQNAKYKRKRAEIFWFLFGIIMIVAPTIWMVSQIREFLEVI